MHEIKQFPFTHELGWSFTRYSTFSVCKRRYYYQYYGKYDEEISLRTIDELKGLVTMPLEIGSIVHEVIGALLLRLMKTSDAIDEDRFYDYASSAVSRSVDGRPFEEQFYGVLEQIDGEAMQVKVRACLANLLGSDRYAWLVEKAAQASDDWIIEPPGYGETRLNGLKAYFKVDFIFPLDDTYYILDWKTGKEVPDKHRQQLIGYAAWATYQFEIAPDQIENTIAYLHPAYKEESKRFNGLDLDSFSVQVRAESEEMKEQLREVEMNIPMEKDYFPLIDEKDRDTVCPMCKFRGLCFPAQYPAVEDPAR